MPLPAGKLVTPIKCASRKDEKYTPRNVRLIPPKSMPRSYADQSLSIKRIYTAEVEYKGSYSISQPKVFAAANSPTYWAGTG